MRTRTLPGVLVALAAALATAPARPRAATATSPAPGGVVMSGGARMELLPPLPPTAELRTPQGFMRVEGGQAPAGAPGSFGTYRASGAAAPAPPGSPEPSVAAGPEQPAATAARAADPCRAARNRYLKRLLRMSGIEQVDDPLALLEGLAGPGGYSGAYLFTAYGLLPDIDPVRPLAWDLELRSLARDLATCGR